MSSPNDFARFNWHVPHSIRVLFRIRECSLNAIQFDGVVVEDGVVLGSQVVSERVSLNRRLEFSQ